MNTSFFYGSIVVLMGLLEMFVTPVIIKRHGDRIKPEMRDRLIRMTRISGLIIVGAGLLMMSGVLSRWSPYG